MDTIGRIEIGIPGEFSVYNAMCAASVLMTLGVKLSDISRAFSAVEGVKGRAEIVDAVNKIISSGEKDITEEVFSNYLYTAGMPPVDLMIRTSGQYRISNFLLWQIAYSELYFPTTLWPDFSPEELNKAIIEYNKRDRRFGGIKCEQES